MEKVGVMSNTDFRLYSVDVYEYIETELAKDIVEEVLESVKESGKDINKETIENAVKERILSFLESDYENLLYENNISDIYIYTEEGNLFFAKSPSSFANYVFSYQAESFKELIDDITDKVINKINKSGPKPL